MTDHTICGRHGTLIDIELDGDNTTFVFTNPIGFSEFWVSKNPEGESVDEFVARARTTVGHRVRFDTREPEALDSYTEVIAMVSEGLDPAYDADAPKFMPLAQRRRTIVAGVLKSIRQHDDRFHAVVETPGGPETVRTRSLSGPGADGVRGLAGAIRGMVGLVVTIEVDGGFARTVSHTSQ